MEILERERATVNDISWSLHSASKIVVLCCFLEFGIQPDYTNAVYIWQISRWKKHAEALTTFRERQETDCVLDRLTRLCNVRNKLPLWN